MEAHIGVAVAVLHTDNQASHRGHAREIAVGLLVGVLGVLLVGGDELVVEVQVHAVAGIELAGCRQALEQQRVHPLVGVEVVALATVAYVGHILGGELAQGAQCHIGTAHANAVVAVPEWLEFHHVLDDIAAAQVVAEQRGEHVAVGVRRLSRAALAEVLVDD